MALVYWILHGGVALVQWILVVVWHRCNGGVALVHWILVVVWHSVLCTGSWWWRCTCAMDPGGGVALVEWILVVAWHWCNGPWW